LALQSEVGANAFNGETDQKHEIVWRKQDFDVLNKMMEKASEMARCS